MLLTTAEDFRLLPTSSLSSASVSVIMYLRAVAAMSHGPWNSGVCATTSVGVLGAHTCRLSVLQQRKMVCACHTHIQPRYKSRVVYRVG